MPSSGFTVIGHSAYKKPSVYFIEVCTVIALVWKKIIVPRLVRSDYFQLMNYASNTLLNYYFFKSVNCDVASII
jgi:hypothetical protein